MTLGNGISIVIFRKCITTSTFEIRNCVFSVWGNLTASVMFPPISFYFETATHYNNIMTLSGCIHPASIIMNSLLCMRICYVVYSIK